MTHANAHPKCKVSCQSVLNRPASSSVLRQGQPDGGESFIVLESRLTCSLLANSSSLVHVVRKICAAG